MTNSTGKLLPPGSAEGVVANTWKPGTFASFICTSGRIWNTVRLRGLCQGFTTTPEKPSTPIAAPAEGGSRIWNVRSASGVLSSAASVARPKKLFWSAVAFAGALMMPKMTPWSSDGASSFGENIYIGMASSPITIQIT